MSLRRFLLLSVLGCAALMGAVWVICRLTGAGPGGRAIVIAGIAGFVTSTSGWTIVVIGCADAPERMAAYFGAGMLLKMLLIGLSTVVVVAGGLVELREFLIAYAAVFLPLGFVQLALTVKDLTRRLDEAQRESGKPAGAGDRGA